MALRLQKFLADAGVASRRKAEQMIAEGRVAVNGVTITTPGVTVTENDTITLDGRTVSPAPPDKKVYIMLHKPEGVVTTLTDPQGRPVVTDLIEGVHTRVYPVGRLDYDSSGLLLLTNDGALTQRLTHPRHTVSKVYAARLRGVPTGAEIRAFCAGLMIEGRRTAPCGCKVMKVTGGGEQAEALAHITLREGRNRQIRKMCEAIGHPVLFLKRIAVGPIKLGGLPRGAWRYLTEAEVAGLQNAAH